MTNDAAPPAVALEQLSALSDGELDDAAVAQACRQWRVDRDLRSSWHAYQLIGDVLRSEDLACPPARDAEFLAALRLRLADEPVVVAPAATEPSLVSVSSAAPGRLPGGRPRSWMTPAAIAAGFVAVVGVVSLMDAPGGSGPLPDALRGSTSPVVAAAAPSADVRTASTAPTAAVPSASGSVPRATDASALVASGQLIRDVRLDRYLSAHKQFAGSSALGVPSGFLRNATADAADR